MEAGKEVTLEMPSPRGEICEYIADNARRLLYFATFPLPPIVESMIKVSPSALTEPYIHAQMPDSLHSRLLTSRRTCSDKLEMKAGSFVCNSKALSLLDTLPNISHKHCSAGRS